MLRIKVYWFNLLLARIVPGDSDKGVKFGARVEGDSMVGIEGLGLLPSYGGREMDSSSSWIAEDMLGD